MVRTTAQLAYGLAAAAGGGGIGVGRLAITKKLVLWSVLILQVGFIGGIWLLQMSYGQGHHSASILDEPQRAARVNFVRQMKTTLRGIAQSKRCGRHENVNRYEEDFYLMKNDRLNHTAEYAMPVYMDLELAPELWCYREGTLNVSKRNDLDYLQLQPQCHCASGWHGRDCGQPEIIWRALMTHSRVSKRSGSAPLQLREASAAAVQRLYYMLDLGHWEHISLELLELQLRTLIEVVDYFLIYYVSNNKERLTQLTLERSLASMLGNNASYVLYHCRKNCSTAAVYNHFHHQLLALCDVQMQAMDLLLYGDRHTVYAPAALKFLKYYAVDVLPLRFRLKYNVYGYYWQHPQRTLLHGVISSLVHVHSAQLPQLKQTASYTVGDLNHYGGWSCQYCLPPEQLVRQLQTSAGGRAQVKLPNDTRGAHIDANYMQQLMARGIYVDGSTQLLKLRQQSEKYFAPDVALLRGSQYAQLLVNLYDVDVLDDVQGEEEE